MSKILRRKVTVNHKRVYRIMGENGLISAGKPRRRPSKASRPGVYFPNLIKDRKFSSIGEAVVTDFTTYLVDGRKRHLAAIKDIVSRRIIGRAVGDRLSKELAIKALEDAKLTRGSLEGCIHHSDRDVAYRSEEYQAKLKEYGMLCSMIEKSVYENASAESFNKTIKYQEINLSDYTDQAEADRSVFRYIRLYNNFRPHSSLNGMTPIEFEKTLVAK